MKLVNRIVTRGELMSTAEKIADRIKSFDPIAVSIVKQAVTRGMNMTLSQGLELEAALAERLQAS